MNIHLIRPVLERGGGLAHYCNWRKDYLKSGIM